MTSSLKRDRVLVLLGGVCIHLVLGTCYLWGSILLYVASFLRSYDSSIDMSMLVGVSPFSGLGFNFGMLFGLTIAEKIGYRLMLGIGILGSALCTFCASFVTSYIAFLFVYGILGGLFGGAIYIIPVVCGWKYFPNNKGLVSGITIGAFGFGAFIFNFVALAIVNPANEDPDDPEGNYTYFDSHVYDRVPSMFRILSICYAALGMIGVFIIRIPNRTTENAHKKIADVPDSLSEQSHHEESLLSSSEQPQQEQGAKSIKGGIFSLPFLALFMIAACGTFIGFFMSNNYKVYGVTVIPDDSFLTLVGSMGSVANGCTRVVWTLFYDKYGFKKVYTVLIIIQATLTGTLSLVSEHKALYLIWYPLIMGCEGGHLAMLPVVSVKVFGMRFGPKIYGVVFWAYAIASFGVYFMTKYGLPVIGWNGIFYIALGLTGVSFMVNLVFKEKILTQKVK